MISSIDDAVSSSELACCSVRDDRSRLPPAIWPDAAVMVSVLPRTSETMRIRLSFMCFNACNNCPASSRVVRSMRLVKSPAATVCAIRTACANGCVIERAIPQANPAPTKSASMPNTISTFSAVR